MLKNLSGSEHMDTQKQINKERKKQLPLVKCFRLNSFFNLIDRRIRRRQLLAPSEPLLLLCYLLLVLIMLLLVLLLVIHRISLHILLLRVSLLKIRVCVRVRVHVSAATSSATASHSRRRISSPSRIHRQWRKNPKNYNERKIWWSENELVI